MSRDAWWDRGYLFGLLLPMIFRITIIPPHIFRFSQCLRGAGFWVLAVTLRVMGGCFRLALSASRSFSLTVHIPAQL
jgi:hypothetical protein